jgi:hypothetical protein
MWKSCGSKRDRPYNAPVSRTKLLAIEAAIIAMGLIVVYALIGWPFGGGDDGTADANPRVTAHPSTAATTPPVSASPAASTSAGARDCGPVVSPSFLSANQIVSYYGNPYAESLGILGEHSPEDLVGLLRQHARTIDDLNGIRGVQPAFHMVYGTAQPNPGEDGLYVNRVDPDTTREYIDIACENGFFVFLDLQNGRSSPQDELAGIEQFLRDPNVHVALDPEFTMGPDEVPGQSIGHLDASTINAVQQQLETFIVENDLPDKILIVHQFDEGMITNKADIQEFPHVRLVIDMDGFGGPDAKIKKFWLYAQPAEHSAIKVFFKQDDPRLTDDQVVGLNPDVIIYQ